MDLIYFELLSDKLTMNLSSYKRKILFSIIALIALGFYFKNKDLISNKSHRIPASLNDWEQVSNGNHRFRQLGDEFYVPLKMKKVEGAKVVLLNERMAKMLGLTTPEDLQEFEKIIIDQFAYMVDAEGTEVANTKEWFATRYQDSQTKNVGDAQGDGRASWAGELLLDTSDGKKRNVDFVLKGTGQTPLAWTNHTQTTHKDGMQGLKEAVHSYIISEANAQNQLDTTVDLAVIKLPLKRLDKEGNEVFTAITLRVGNQTRLAHLRYFTDSPDQFKRIFHFILRRDLGLNENAVIEKRHIDQFLKQFTDNLADEMARYYDLHVTHGSPTPGNRTTVGSSIDLSTMRYHEAHHGNFKYLGGMQMKDQEKHLQSYITYLYRYIQEAAYPYPVTESDIKEMKLQYRKKINRHLENLWLTRLGFSDSEISSLNGADKRKFVKLLKEMHQLEGKNPIRYAGKDMLPAAFDMRKIISTTAQTEIDSLANNTTAYTKLFQSEKSWDSLSDLEKRPWKNSYQAIYQKLTAQLNPTPEKRAQWASRSAILTQNKNNIRGQSKLKNREIDLINKMETETGGLSDWNKQAHELAADLKDDERPRRLYNNLGVLGEIGSINRSTFNGCTSAINTILDAPL